MRRIFLLVPIVLLLIVSCAGLHEAPDKPEPQAPSAATPEPDKEQPPPPAADSPSPAEPVRAKTKADTPAGAEVTPRLAWVPAPEDTLPGVIVEPSLPDPWDAQFAQLTTKAGIGQLFFVEVRDPDTGAHLTSLTESYRKWAREIQPGGYILFANNLVSPEQTRELIDDLNTLTPIPPFIAMDEEGGIVSRLNAVPAMKASPQPTAREIGLTNNTQQAADAARTIAEHMSSLGFSVNFAPVADIHVPGSGGAIGERSFGDHPEGVARMVTAFSRGLQEQGIMAVAKHFPGHGAASGDSHDEKTLLDADYETLLGRELVPFIEAVDAEIGGIMTGHITVPALDPSMETASLSSDIIIGLLRKRLGFDGLVFTDSLRMRGVTAFYNIYDLPLLAFEAGADILLMPVSAKTSQQRILDAFRSDRISPARLAESLERIKRAKRRFLASP